MFDSVWDWLAAIGIAGLVGLAGKLIHWLWDYRKKKAEALKAEAELADFQFTVRKRMEAEGREETIKAHVKDFQKQWDEKISTLKARGVPTMNMWPVGGPVLLEGEDSEIVAEAWKRFLGQLQRR